MSIAGAIRNWRDTVLEMSIDGLIGVEEIEFVLGLAAAHMNGLPSQVHPVLQASYERVGAPLEHSIAELPIDFADEALLRAVWQHIHMLAGSEVHEALIEVCQRAAALVGIQFGPVPACAESQPGMLS